MWGSQVMSLLIVCDDYQRGRRVRSRLLIYIFRGLCNRHQPACRTDLSMSGLNGEGNIPMVGANRSGDGVMVLSINRPKIEFINIVIKLHPRRFSDTIEPLFKSLSLKTPKICNIYFTTERFWQAATAECY